MNRTHNKNHIFFKRGVDFFKTCYILVVIIKLNKHFVTKWFCNMNCNLRVLLIALATKWVCLKKNLTMEGYVVKNDPGI